MPWSVFDVSVLSVDTGVKADSANFLLSAIGLFC
jgi:hypothetical protein